jgi:ribonuclease HI
VSWVDFFEEDLFFDWETKHMTPGPSTRTMSVFERMGHFSKASGVGSAEKDQGDTDDEKGPDVDSLSFVRETWQLLLDPDLPACSRPAPKATLIEKPIKVDLSLPEQREAYAEKVRVCLDDGANSTQALQRAARQMPIQPPNGPARPAAGHGARTAKPSRKRQKTDQPDAEDMECTQLLNACLKQDGHAVQKMHIASVISREHVLRCQLGMDVNNTLAELYELALAWQRKHCVQRQLQVEAARERDRRQRRDAAALVWATDPSQAYADMTKPPQRSADCSLQIIAEEVRDRGSMDSPGREGDLEDAQDHFGPHYMPHPSEQYDGLDLLTAWDSSAHPILPQDPPDQPLHQPRSLTTLQIREWRQQQECNDDGRRQWLRDGQLLLPTKPPGAVVWPDRATPYVELGGWLAGLIVGATRDGAFHLLPDNTLRFTFTDKDLIHEFRVDGLEVNGRMPDMVIVTDGSGSHEVNGDASPCGFGTFVITVTSVTVLIGGSRRSTSGLMELAAAGAGFDHLARTGAVNLALLISDYKTLVDADLGRHRGHNFRKLQNVGTWQCIVQALEQIAIECPNLTVERVHAKSHEGVVGHWGQQMNEVADVLAKLGRAMANGLPLHLPDEEDTTLADHILPWVAPDLQVAWATQHAIDKAMGPANAGEAMEAIHTRGAKGHDVNGVSVKMAKAAGQSYIDAACEEFNLAWYAGRYPSNRQNRTIIGKHSALQKQPSGLRHLQAPEVLQNIVSAMVATRITQLTLASRAMARAQKCNIPRVAGTAENNFLVHFALYDFFAAARDGLLEEGAVRIMMLSDISKAFDRVQLTVLLHALQTLFAHHDITRLLAAIQSLYEQTRIAVSKKDVAVLIEKLAGVHQGDPASAILFALVMEFVRRLIPPSRRYKIRFHTYHGSLMVRLEIDYADDQIRFTDTVDDMQDTVDTLKTALAKVGLHWNPSKVLLVAFKYTDQQGVRLFDPRISYGTDAQGHPVYLDVMRQEWDDSNDCPVGDVFKSLGVLLTWRAHAGPAGLAASDKAKAKIGQILNSDYPFPAKLRCLQVCVTRMSEHIFFTAWVPPDILEELDKVEMGSVRLFLGINLANAILQGPDFKLAMRTWRQEIIHLTGFVRALGSPDHRLKAAALAMSKHAEPAGRAGQNRGELLDPPFFDWRWRPLAIEEHPTAAPDRLAFLAHKWGVGFTEADGKLVVTLDGTILMDPAAILKRLARKKEKRLLEALERRDSTNQKKNAAGLQAPAFSIAWGIAGWVDKHRHERTAFYGPGSTFTDTEIKILLRLRVLLWPTGLNRAICSGGVTTARCYCGIVCQTATHLLNVPWEAQAHSLALRMVPRVRHNEALQLMIGSFFPDGPSRGMWSLVHAEGSRDCPTVATHPDYDRLRRQIGTWVAERLLAQDDGAQHYRTDLIVASAELKQIIIYDMCFGSDDKLAVEDAMISTWAAQRAEGEPVMGMMFWKNNWFDEQGRITPEGRRRHPDVQPHHVFKHARYVRRYAKLRNRLLAYQPKDWKVFILPIAAGVIGLIPDFTRHHLQRVLGRKEANELIKLLIRTAQRGAIQAWRAWALEGPRGPS